ncbi:hypothetical protein NC652_019584 [Populus alba x Populus x berolinensis]|nr:hypothetical protein NC652_019584 [Populus alba x Populus x berolinensis]
MVFLFIISSLLLLLMLSSQQSHSSLSSLHQPVRNISKRRWDGDLTVLRNIFYHEPLKKGEKRDHGYSILKEKYTSMDVSDIVEEDEEAFLNTIGKREFSGTIPQLSVTILWRVCDPSGPELGSSFVIETEKVTSPPNLNSELPVELNENLDNCFWNRSYVLLESFGSGDYSEPGNLPLSESRCHPQLLRLESRLE